MLYIYINPLWVQYKLLLKLPMKLHSARTSPDVFLYSRSDRNMTVLFHIFSSTIAKYDLLHPLISNIWFAGLLSLCLHCASCRVVSTALHFSCRLLSLVFNFFFDNSSQMKGCIYNKKIKWNIKCEKDCQGSVGLVHRETKRSMQESSLPCIRGHVCGFREGGGGLSHTIFQLLPLVNQQRRRGIGLLFPLWYRSQLEPRVDEI